MSTSKGRRTRRRGEVRVEAATVASSMREWLSDRLALAQKRNAAGRRVRPSGSGVTLEMKAISAKAKLRDPEWVVRHEHRSRAMLRGGLEPTGTNRPYVNRARDLKRGRRLRPELRGGAS